MRWLIEWKSEAEHDVQTGSQVPDLGCCNHEPHVYWRSIMEKEQVCEVCFHFLFQPFYKWTHFKVSIWVMRDPAKMTISKENRSTDKGIWTRDIEMNVYLEVNVALLPHGRGWGWKLNIYLQVIVHVNQWPTADTQTEGLRDSVRLDSENLSWLPKDNRMFPLKPLLLLLFIFDLTVQVK